MAKQGQATTAARGDEELVKMPGISAERQDEASDAEEQPQSDASRSDDEDDDDGAEPQDESDFSDGGDVDDGGVADAESDEEALEAVGFGDAMNKILQQNVAEDAQPILAKRTTARMREILSEKKQTKTARLSAAEKRLKEEKDMVIPDHTTLVKDRQLRAIATKGVVALFNAIEKHQHQAGKKDEKSTKKVKEMSKDNFLGLLKASQKSVEEQAPAAATKKSSWAVVQDDYMMDAKLKDWDAAHGTEVGRVRAEDDDEKEAAEAVAWSQVSAAMDSDGDEGGVGPAKKRRGASAGSKAAAKKTKRS